MQMRIVLQRGDTYLLEPIQELVIGWRVRPGTFRVAQPYDRPAPSTEHNPNSVDTDPIVSSTDTPEPSGPFSTSITSRPHKKLRISKDDVNETHVPKQDLELWIQSEFRSLAEQDHYRSFVSSMRHDYFYGTCVDAPVNDTFTLDLVQLQPTLRMLRSGFASATVTTPVKARRHGNDESTIKDDVPVFDNVQLEAGLQHLDLSDIYEAVVANNHSEPALVSFPIKGEPLYLIPPRSGFVVSDLDRIDGLKSVARQRGGFDVVVMDPPWQNASVDRMEHYRTLDLYDLFRIPILDLLRTAEVRGQPGIVAVWITNRAKIKRVVIEKLFPAWGLELAAHWTWLKVTTGGEPVLSLNNRHRKPYEGILIGRQKQQKEQMSSGKGQAFDSGSNKRLLVSVPGQHSRKPSLMKLLEEEFFPRTDTPPSDLVSCPDSIVGDNQPSTRIPLNQLELFARNLEEGVLSWGNEPIRHQYCGRTSSNPYTVQDGYLVTLDPCAVGQCNSG